VFLLAALVCRGEAGEGKKPAKLTAEEARRVTALIEQLDSKVFAQRDKATKELAALGERVLPMLDKAAQRDVPLEVQRRLGMLIWKVRAPARQQEAERIAGLIRDLANARYEARQAAMKDLQAIGRAALEQLYAATLGPDLEVCFRAHRTITNILQKKP
jgi:hypothetical protein